MRTERMKRADRMQPVAAMFRTKDGSVFHLDLDPRMPARIGGVYWRGIALDIEAFVDQLDDCEWRELAWLLAGELT